MKQRKQNAFDEAMQSKKEQLYDKIPISKRGINVILYTALLLLGIVIVLIALEALGIYKIG